MNKYYKVYLTLKGSYTAIEIARFTSKGLMHICLESIINTYKNTDHQVTWDHDFKD